MGNKTLITTILMLALLSTDASASDFRFSPIGDNRFDSRVDLNNLNWFDRGLYKASLPYQDCVDIDEFYAYADSNPHDNLDRSDVMEYSDRLSYRDYKRIADSNPHDGIDASSYLLEDMRCSSFGDDNQYDYDRREDNYATYDYIYNVDPYGLIRTDGQGGFSSWAPLDYSW